MVADRIGRIPWEPTAVSTRHRSMKRFGPVLLLLAMLTSCRSHDIPTAVMSGGDSPAPPIILVAAQEQNAGDQALFSGRLDVRDGCLVFHNGGTWVPVWPSGYALITESDGRFTVVNEQGEAIATTGGPVRVVGGETNSLEAGGQDAADRWVSELIGSHVPEACAGGAYWGVTREPYPART